MDCDVFWDDDGRNVEHCEDNKVSTDEVEYVFDRALLFDVTTSKSSGLPMLFGETWTKRRIAIVFEFRDPYTVRPVTAYEPKR